MENKIDKNPNVLILDDDQGILDIFVDNFSNINFIPHVASRIQDAVEIIENHPIDLVIADVFLDKESGMDFLKMVKNYDRNIRVILMTSDPSTDTIIQGQRLGGDDFIIKPITFSLLMVRLRHHLEMRELSEKLVSAQLENEKLKAIAQIGVTYNDQLNSPLTAIFGYLDILEESVSKGNNEYLIRIKEAALQIQKKLKKLSMVSTLYERAYPQSKVGMFQLQ